VVDRRPRWRRSCTAGNDARPDHHVGSLVSVDLFTVPTVMFKVLFVFVVLAHERRRVVHINVTDAPTAQWTGQ
jgi:hypothetical protein